MKYKACGIVQHVVRRPCSTRLSQRWKGLQRSAMGLAVALTINQVMSPSALAEEAPELSLSGLQHSTTLVFENDIFTGQDSGYTNGVALLFSMGPFRSFTSDTVPAPVANLVRRTWMANPSRRERARVYSLVQTMQTPEDLTIETLQEDQPPYAGLLLGALTLYAFDDRVVDLLTLTLGVVGPLSLAEESQTLIHAITSSDDPAGWDTQLDNELVFQVQASRGFRLAEHSVSDTVSLDFIAQGGAAAGTVASFVSASFIARFGKGLSLTFPVASLLPNRQTNANVFSASRSWYGFIGAESQFIANDIQINGNTFENSHSIPLDNTRERLSAGVSFSMGQLGFTFLYADVPGNSREDPFGAVSVTYRH